MSTSGLFLQPLPILVPRRSEISENLDDGPATDFLLAVQDPARSALSQGIAWTSLMDLLSSSEDENLLLAAATPSPNHRL